MKKIAFLLILAVIVMASCTPKKETPREIKSYTIEQFYKNTSIGGGSFSPDESKLLLTSNESGIYNIYEYPIDGSEPKQVTNFEDRSVFGIGYFPEDERFLFSSDNNGDEINHIFMQDTAGVTTDITPWEGAKSSFYGWARDKKSFFFTSNKRDERFFDLYEMDIASMEATLVYQNEKGFSIGSISKNKRFVALVQSITTSNSEMFLYDRETEETKHISEHEGDATFNPQFFDLKNEYLYFLTDEGGEFTYLSRYNIGSGAKEKVWEADWDVWYAYESYNSKYRIIGVNEDAKTKVYVFNLADGTSVEMPAFEDGDIKSISVSKSEKLVKMSVGASTSPNNIYVYNLETKELKKLTDTLNPEINEEDLVAGKVIRYKSFDGLDIPAILYKPHQADTGKVPALVWVHGGPGGQSRVSYFSLIQYLVNHGYAIIAVNNRGSSGYGKTFFKMDNQKHGDVDLKDCIYAKKYMQKTGWVDESKIGIIGGSYGGYMVMAALCFTPEEFDVGVNIFGVTNWLRTLKSIPPYWESFRKALYDELGDPNTADSVRLYNISPVFHADKVTKPLMVLQGANDPRVLQVESDEIVEAVKANGVPVEYVLFPDEGHGFVKKENEIKGYGQILTFLDQYLK